jgi:hypothetical protein
VEAGTDRVEAVAELLHNAGETHHIVFGIVDGNDADWATWYSDWLINLSKLPEWLGKKPVRSELTFMLVKLDKDYTSAHPSETWERWYAARLMEHFQ